MSSSELSALREAVEAARVEVSVARARGPSPRVSDVRVVHRGLWDALEAYAGALSRRGYPLPHAISRDLAVYRAMFAVRGRDTR